MPKIFDPACFSAQANLPPMAFTNVWWESHKVTDHDREPLLTLMTEYNIFRGARRGECWAVPTGLHMLTIGGHTHSGTRAWVWRKIEEFCEANPLAMSEDALAIIAAFIKEREATDGRPGVPQTHTIRR
jgi:hypothetical protein